MTDGQIFTSRLNGRPLLDGEGLTIGRIRDVVILPAAGKDPPRALGLVVTLQRRRIFVNLGKIAEISIDGAHLQGGAIDLDRFARRTGEILASELFGRHVEDGTIVDVAISPDEQRRVGWEVSALAVSHGRSLLRRGPTIVPWDQHPELFQTDPLAEQLVGLRELKAGRPRYRCRGHAAQPPQPDRGGAGRWGTGRPAGGDARTGPGPATGRARA